MTYDRPVRRAFTMIELLVVSAIIAIVLALLLPAVQKIREAANKIKCAQNLKQLALACHAYHGDWGKLPPGGLGRNRDWTQEQGSWLVHVLPYMDQQQLYQNKFAPEIQGDNPGDVQKYGVNRPEWERIRPPHYLRCPSDDFPHEEYSTTNYVGSMGPQCIADPGGSVFCPAPYEHFCNTLPGIPASPTDGHTDQRAEARGCFTMWGAPVNFGNIKDGTSMTILAGEIRPGENWRVSDNGNDRWFPSPVSGVKVRYSHWIGLYGPSWGSTLPPINFRTDEKVTCDPRESTEQREHSYYNLYTASGFKSRHPAGAHVVFADGSVRFFSEELADVPRQYLGCRHDQQVISEDALP